MSNLIALAVPAFLLAIGVEALLARRQGRKLYRLADALSDLGCGISQQVLLVLATPALVAGYSHLYQAHRQHTFESTAAVWIVATLGVDFIQYWWHRASHRVSILWAAHVVHHQSEDFNLAVALRQAVFTSFTSFPFYLPLAILGVPPTVYFASSALNTLYQFWVHTQLVGRLGPLELVLNTPSHHRVHHAINAPYLDKNYGGILIVWDRLFGTFAAEGETPVYGTVKPFASFNPVWAQLTYFCELAERARPLSWSDRLKLPFMPPDWPPEPPAGQPRASPPAPALSRARAAWLLAGFGPLIALTVLVMLGTGGLSGGARALVIGWVLASLLAMGGVLDRRRWGWPLEIARLAGLVAGAGAWVALR